MGEIHPAGNGGAEPWAGGTEIEQAVKRAMDFFPSPEYARKKRYGAKE